VRRVIASGFGTGLILGKIRGSDLGSGTVGSAFALVVSVLLGGWQLQLAAAIVFAGLSVWASAKFADDGDPGWVVIDEMAGTFIATLGLGGYAVVVSWLVFRAADIFKKRFPGVAAAERLPGGWGITADDLLAGAYGLIAGWIVRGLI